MSAGHRTAPAVTVVVPTRDRLGLLSETLASIAVQTMPVEIVVVDDGSVDGTADWLAGRDLRVVRHPAARGAPVARNAGAALATTPWLAFCDDDDLWAPDRLASQLAALADHPTARWATCGSVTIDADRKVIGGQAMPDHEDLPAMLRRGNPIPGGGSSVLVDRVLFTEVGGFAEDLVGGQDWELWVRLAARSPVGYVHRPLVAYRAWPGNASHDLDRMRRAYAEVRRRHAMPLAPGDPGHRAWRLHAARHFAEDGARWAAAREYLGAGVRGAPGQLAYAAAVIAAPARVVRRLRERDLASLPPGWREEARRWLAARPG